MESSKNTGEETPLSSEEKNFLLGIPDSQFDLVHDTAIQGPDGFPYLVIKSGTLEKGSYLLNWCAQKVIGLVVTKSASDEHVLTYGVIWNWIEHKQFYLDSLPNIDLPKKANKETDIETNKPTNESTSFFTANPSNSFFPPYARSLLKEFLQDQGILNPRMTLAIRSESDYDLCFSIESLSSPPASEHEGIVMALSWFFPRHYSIGLAKEGDLPGFINL